MGEWLRWIEVIDSAGGWRVERYRGPVLGEFQSWEDAVHVARAITAAEGGSFVVRGEDRASRPPPDVAP